MSPLCWNDLWLNEGFAQYFQYLGVEAVQPHLRFMEQFVLSDLHQALIADSFESSQPISTAITYPEEIGFNLLGNWRIIYSKGASLIRMMDTFLTTDTLKKVHKMSEITVS